MLVEVIIGSFTLASTLGLGFFGLIKFLTRQNSEQVKLFVAESSANRKVILDNTEALTAMKEYLQNGSKGKIKKRQQDL